MPLADTPFEDFKNIGGIFSTGPVEAAYVINSMVKPKAVIASHANEAATEGGRVLEELAAFRVGLRSGHGKAILAAGSLHVGTRGRGAAGGF